MREAVDAPRKPRPDLGTAEWESTSPIGPETISFDASVVEEACTGGSPSADRIVGPAVEYRQDALVVTFMVQELRTPAAASPCIGNPATTVRVDLAEPLGTRILLDGAEIPPRPPHLSD